MKTLKREAGRRPRSKVIEAMGLAVLIHLAAMPFLGVLIPEPRPRGEMKKVQVVSLVSRGSLTKHKQPKLDTERKPAQNKETPKEEEKPDEDLEGIVVDLPPSPDDTPPEQSDFLSEHNTRTERETISRHRTLDYKNAMNELTRAEQESASPQESKTSQALVLGPNNPSEHDKDEAGAVEEALELPTLKQRDRLALEMDDELGTLHNQTQSERLLGNSDRLALSTGEATSPRKAGSAPAHGPANLDLMPEVGVLARISGAPPSDLPSDLDIEEGEGTFLNSREFKYASFFNRLKRGISQHWRPLAEYRRRDPTGNIYGQRSRVTVLEVILKPDGSLHNIEVSRSSGVDFLDREAISAFRRAEPFPNPPKGLVDNGLIRFPFGFHIDFTRRGLNLPF